MSAATEELDVTVGDFEKRSITTEIGQAALAGNTAVQSRKDSYRYELSRDRQGLITGAESWKYVSDEDKATYSCFDADGKQVSRILIRPSTGDEFHYDNNDNLVYSYMVFNGGNYIERHSYDNKGNLEVSIVVDIPANTHTIITYHPEIGGWIQRVSPYEGREGMVDQVVD